MLAELNGPINRSIQILRSRESRYTIKIDSVFYIGFARAQRSRYFIITLKEARKRTPASRKIEQIKGKQSRGCKRADNQRPKLISTTG